MLCLKIRQKNKKIKTGTINGSEQLWMKAELQMMSCPKVERSKCKLQNYLNRVEQSSSVTLGRQMHPFQLTSGRDSSA